MNVEEKLNDMDKKLDVLIQRYDDTKKDVSDLKNVVYGKDGRNGLRMQVRLLEEQLKVARWALRTSIGSALGAAGLAAWKLLGG